MKHEATRSISTPPLVGMLVHRRVTPSINFASTHLYNWVERGTVKVKCPAQEHNPMSLARARTRTVSSGVECTNQEATLPPKKKKNKKRNTDYKMMVIITYLLHLTVSISSVVLHHQYVPWSVLQVLDQFKN